MKTRPIFPNGFTTAHWKGRASWATGLGIVSSSPITTALPTSVKGSEKFYKYPIQKGSVVRADGIQAFLCSRGEPCSRRKVVHYPAPRVVRESRVRLSTNCRNMGVTLLRIGARPLVTSTTRPAQTFHPQDQM